MTFNSCDSLEEAKYLLEHFVTMSISKVGLVPVTYSYSLRLPPQFSLHSFSFIIILLKIIHIPVVSVHDPCGAYQ